MNPSACPACAAVSSSTAAEVALALGPSPAGSPRGTPGDLPLARGRVLLVGTGAFGVSTLPSWALLLRSWYGWTVRACLTSAATRLVAPAALAAATGHAVSGPDWDTEPGVPHQVLADWPDLVLVAPATLSFVAKCALGMPDSLALATVMATSAPVLVVPSVAERSLGRPSTQRHLEALREEGYHVVGPRPGISVHTGSSAPGAMADIATTLRAAWHVLHHAVAAPAAPPDTPGQRIEQSGEEARVRPAPAVLLG